MIKKILFSALILTVIFTYQLQGQIYWIQQTSGTLENLNGIYFTDANTGWAVGNNGLVLKTTNGGNIWFSQYFPVTSHNTCVFFATNTTGYVGNYNSFVYKTTDGGNNWNALNISSTYPITSLYFLTDRIGWSADNYGRLRKTTNGGLNWANSVLVSGYRPRIFFLNNDRGWTVDSYGYCYRTTNGGTNFQATRVNYDTLSGIKFVSSTLGYACGDSGKVFRTTNGGVNWVLQNTGVTEKLNYISTKGGNYIWIAGNRGRILFSGNNGTYWNIMNYGINNLNGIDFPTQTAGFISGDLGTILHAQGVQNNACIGYDTIRTGYPFYTYYMDSRTQMLYTYDEITSNGGSAGNIIKIGFNFTNAASQVMNGFKIKMQNYALTSITGFENAGWTVVYDGIYAVPGTGWRFIDLQLPFFWDGSSNLLIDICFNNSSYTSNSNVLSSVAEGKILHQHADLSSGDGCSDIITPAGNITARPNICLFVNYVSGTGNTGSQIPNVYKLEQNFPNPFNPVTKINYAIPKQGFVTLKVYDILGREVRTLVNEVKTAGVYAVDFDGTELSSGIYFYRIHAGNFVQVKRMILVK